MYDPDAPPKPPRQPTINDVAVAANVSKQTISRVINGRGDVSESTRKRVLEVIEELGYRPNVLARGLVTNQSPAIGLVVPDISNTFYPEIARGVEDGAQAAGYSVFLCNAAGSTERELQALDRLRGHRISGLILCTTMLPDEVLSKALNGLSPVVLIHRDYAGASGRVTWPGYATGGAMATNHLIDLGYRKIAYLGMATGNRLQVEKYSGYCLALERAGIPHDDALLASNAPTFHGGYQAMLELRERGVSLDAVFAMNDYMAAGALRFAALHGLKVPDDLAVVGFGGSEITEMTNPTLTTIGVPLYDFGAMAVAELICLMSRGKCEDHHSYPEPRLIVRASTTGVEPDMDRVTCSNQGGHK